MCSRDGLIRGAALEAGVQSVTYSNITVWEGCCGCQPPTKKPLPRACRVGQHPRRGRMQCLLCVTAPGTTAGVMSSMSDFKDVIKSGM